MKKYKLTDQYKTITVSGEKDHKLYKIQNLMTGKYGGWVENEECLSQEGECWIVDTVSILSPSKVSGDSFISGNVLMYGGSEVSGKSTLHGCILLGAGVSIHDSKLVNETPVDFFIGGENIHLNRVTAFDDCKIIGENIEITNTTIKDSKIHGKNIRIVSSAVYDSAVDCDEYLEIDHDALNKTKIIYKIYD